MTLLTVCSIILISFLGESFFSEASTWTQSLCVKHFSLQIYGEWKAALICGSPLQPSKEVQALKSLGLIHLIVVSGAHLIFFESFLLKPISTLFPRQLRFIFCSGALIIYSFFAGLQAPILRALYQNFSPFSLGKRIFFSSLCTALFFKSFSLSLLLSWSCSLLLSWPSLIRSNAFIKSVVILIGLYPLLTPLGVPSLSVALLQPLFSFFFGGIVFPLTIVSQLLPFETLTNHTWLVFFELLNWSSSHSPPVLFSESDLISLYYVIALQFFYLQAEVKEFRKRLWGKAL